jgi:hypothetical protein
VIPRDRHPQLVCQVCLGVGEVLDPPLPSWCQTGADVIAWAEAEGARNIPCRACRRPGTSGLTPAKKIAQIGSYGVHS